MIVRYAVSCGHISRRCLAETSITAGDEIHAGSFKNSVSYSG